MARHGENIRKRSDGRWEGRYGIYDMEKGKKIYHSVYGHTYDEVKDKLIMKKSLIQTLPHKTEQFLKTSSTLVFSQVAIEWLKKVSERTKHSTYIKYSSIYRLHLADTLGNCPLSQIDSSRIQAVIAKHQSESIQKSIYCVTNQIFKYAFENYSIHISPLRKIYAKGKKKTLEIFTRAEQIRLFSCLYNETDKYKTAIILCMNTGLRLGELCALKWSDIDFNNHIISVNRTVQRIMSVNKCQRTVLLETAPKSESSKREIPISAEILILLAKLQNNQQYVFGGLKPLEPRTLQYHFKKILQYTQIANKNFHILRHTFATNCMENNADIKCLSEILGHSNVKVTLDCYVHPTMDSKRKQLNKLFRFYGQVQGQSS